MRLLKCLVLLLLAQDSLGRTLVVLLAPDLPKLELREKNVMELAVQDMQLQGGYSEVITTIISSQRSRILENLPPPDSDVLFIVAQGKLALLQPLQLANFPSLTMRLLVLSPASCANQLRIPQPIAAGQSALLGILQDWHQDAGWKSQPVEESASKRISQGRNNGTVGLPQIHQLSYIDRRCTLQDWERQHILVGSLEMPPFVSSERTADDTLVTWHGSNMDLFDSLMSSLHLRYSVIRPEAGTFGSTVVVNGTGEGLVGNAVTHQVDITIFPFMFDRRYQPFLDIVWPTFYGRWGVVIPPPTIQYDVLSNTKPYQPEVWLVIVASTIAVASTMWIFSKIFGDETDYGLDLLYSVSLISGQGGFSPKHLPGRVVTTGWNLAAVIIVYTYTSILISFISAPVAEPLIETFQDFISKGSLKPVVNRGHIFATDFLEATSGIPKAMGDIYRNNPDTLVDFDSEAVEKVLKGGYAYITGRPMAESAILRDFRTQHKCRMTLAKEKGLGLDVVGWYTSKHVPVFTEALRTKVMVAMEGGLLMYFNQMYSPNIPCFNPANLVPVVYVLTVLHLQTAFALLGLGIGLSALVFLIEHFRHRLAKQTN